MRLPDYPRKTAKDVIKASKAVFILREDQRSLFKDYIGAVYELDSFPLGIYDGKILALVADRFAMSFVVV